MTDYALIAFSASWLVLVIGGRPRLLVAKVLFAAGMGPLLFGFFRAVLLGFYHEHPHWFQQWEEWSELAGICLACLLVGLFFRQRPQRALTDGRSTSP